MKDIVHRPAGGWVAGMAAAFIVAVALSACGGGGGGGGGARTTPGLLAFAAEPSSRTRSGQVLETQPVLKVLNADGTPRPEPDIRISVAISTGDGALGGTINVTSDDTGVATFTDLAITGSPGPNTLTFSAEGHTSISAIVTVRGITISAHAGEHQDARVGEPVTTPPVAKVTDADGFPVAGATVTFEARAGDGTIEGAVQQTDAQGLAGVGAWSPGSVGENVLLASTPDMTGDPARFTATATAPETGPTPPFTIAAHAGEHQDAIVDTPVATPPVARVTDADGVPVAGATVTFEVGPEDGTIEGAVQGTDAQGLAGVDRWVPGSVGENTLLASTPDMAGDPARFTANATAPFTVVAFAGEQQDARVDEPVETPPVAKVTDEDGNPVAGVTVTFEAGRNDGTVEGAVQQTDAQGLAGVDRWTPGTIGENVLLASTAGMNGNPARFTANADGPRLEAEFNGLNGYVAAHVDGGGHQHGFAYYTAIAALNPDLVADTQLGWTTWIFPDNSDSTTSMCPPDAPVVALAPGHGPTYWRVYQTIEGGAGLWTSSRIPSVNPKFRVNSTPDCYVNEVASSAWGFYGDLLPDDKIGLAQLSNRLLVVPDGLPLVDPPVPSLLGYGWVALPLVPPYVPPSGIPTGDQSWTLFLRAQNFRGPVAFLTAELWSAVNGEDPNKAGRGMDARKAIAEQVAMEFARSLMFTGQDGSGRRYRRIPRLTFGVDSANRAVLFQDVQYYSKAAIWNQVERWMADGIVATEFEPAGVRVATIGQPSVWSPTLGAVLGQGGRDINQGDSFRPVTWAAGGSQKFGFEWAGGVEAGVVPEYFVEEVDGTWTPVPKNQVPRETHLTYQRFPTAPRRSFPDPDRSGSSPWTDTGWSVTSTSTVTLLDGSTVEYVWYKFTDQPAIVRLGLSDDVLQRLQAFVESLHANAGTTGVTIPAPASGTLVAIDPALIVSPPLGLETGYVPVVIGQR